MYWFSEGDLVGEIARLRLEGQKPYWWYRDVLLQAQDRGLVGITAHSEDTPFWWRWFDDSVEVRSDRLRQELKGQNVSDKPAKQATKDHPLSTTL